MSSIDELFEIFLDYLDEFVRWIGRHFCPWIGVPAFIAACLTVIFIAPSCKKLVPVSSNTTVIPLPKTGSISLIISSDWGRWSPWSLCTANVCDEITQRHRECAYGYTCNGFADEQASCDIQSCRKVITDASTSIGNKNYVKVKEFVESIAKELHVGGSNRSHFAMIHYSWKAFLDFDFKHSRNWNFTKVDKEIMRSPYIYGFTRTDLALRMAEEKVFCDGCGGRKNVQKVLIVITDGKSNMGSIPMTEATKKLKDQKVIITAMGVGSRVNRKELIEIASDKEHVFLLSDFDGLMDKLVEIVNSSCPEFKVQPIPGGWTLWTPWSTCTKTCGGGIKKRSRTCTNPVPKYEGAPCVGGLGEVEPCNTQRCYPVCKKIADIAVLTDASTSVHSDNYYIVKRFVVRITEEFKVDGFDNSHFAMIHYSGYPRLDFNFNDKELWDPIKLKEKIMKSEYSHGGTRTDLALKMAEEKIFCDTCGARKDVIKVVIVITDGKSNAGLIPMKEASKGLKDKGVIIITVGIGKEVDQNELMEIASDDKQEHVLFADDFKQLIDSLKSIHDLSCVAPST